MAKCRAIECGRRRIPLPAGIDVHTKKYNASDGRGGEGDNAAFELARPPGWKFPLRMKRRMGLLKRPRLAGFEITSVILLVTSAKPDEISCESLGVLP